MKAVCKMSKEETTWPCSARACPLFFDCLLEYEKATRPIETNADRIRSMNDKALAAFLGEWADGPKAWRCDSSGAVIAWLREPAPAERPVEIAEPGLTVKVSRLMIDKQTLLPELSMRVDGSYITVRLPDPVDLSELESVAWIPVERELPPPLETVLVYAPVFQSGRRVRMAFMTEGGTWCSDGCLWTQCAVKAWRHMPEPPERVEWLNKEDE